jgi:hypothetical protein
MNQPNDWVDWACICAMFAVVNVGALWITLAVVQVVRSSERLRRRLIDDGKGHGFQPVMKHERASNSAAVAWRTSPIVVAVMDAQGNVDATALGGGF